MTDHFDDDATRDILQAASSAGRTSALSDAAIAAWVEGRLDPERAALVEAHLATDDETRAYAFALRDEMREAANENGSVPAVGNDVARSADAACLTFGSPAGRSPAT